MSESDANNLLLNDESIEANMTRLQLKRRGGMLRVELRVTMSDDLRITKENDKRGRSIPPAYTIGRSRNEHDEHDEGESEGEKEEGQY